jgi:hypothetical protein
MFHLYKIEKNRRFISINFKSVSNLNDIVQDDYDGIYLYVTQNKTTTTKIINYECDTGSIEPFLKSDDVKNNNQYYYLLKDVLKYLDYIKWTKKINIIPIKLSGRVGCASLIADINRLLSKSSRYRSQIIIMFSRTLIDLRELKAMKDIFNDIKCCDMFGIRLW